MYIGDLNGFFYCVHHKDGLIWQTKIDGAVISNPVISENIVYVGSVDSCLYGFDKHNGKILFKFESDGEIKGDSVIDDEYLYLGNDAGSIYRIDKKNKDDTMHLKIDGKIFFITLSGDFLYFSDFKNNIYCINKDTLEIHWKKELPGLDDTESNIIVLNNRCYIAGKEGVFILRESDGEILNQIDIISLGYISVSNQNLYIVDENKILYIYDLNTEKIVYMYSATQISISPVISDGIIYLTGDDGEISALE